MDTALTVLNGPAVAPVSIEVLRRHIRVDYEDDDDLLGFYLSSAVSLAEEWLSRALITQSLRWSVGRRFMPTAAGPSPYVPLFFPGGNAFGLPNMDRLPLELPRSPVQSVQSVQLVRQDGNVEPLEASQYVLENDLQPAHLRLLPGADRGPVNHLIIAFTAGYGNAGSCVPAPIIHAVMMIAAYLYENRGDTDAEIPSAAMNLMAPYRLVTFGG
ncbi:head-tail connector protein [Acetobacter oeni]|uniref:Phage gp6-like head-tail connector protein n=1 Tax=Acetobacter oeni TaxID=304077 RepID=A0A511XP73_9PROT|nr:phage head-tail connector protein [Acetobacter oeni]MBB3884485.1 hypothetical protein [Acetobacter oeni]NHO20417.1 hypothetical protein [Acetobacter oeni]GBR00526.1 hypothetical protein AA21952_0131 [Acetobacter oeni LMG 21952]GEN64704.1 hypothetical protein AOE01nite_29280 [Acetobacter oeni]